jgi:hypothetical protein
MGKPVQYAQISPVTLCNHRHEAIMLKLAIQERTNIAAFIMEKSFSGLSTTG